MSFHHVCSVCDVPSSPKQILGNKALNLESFKECETVNLETNDLASKLQVHQSKQNYETESVCQGEQSKNMKITKSIERTNKIKTDFECST